VASWPLLRRVRQVIMASAQFSDLAAAKVDAADGIGAFVLFGQPPAGSGPAISSGIAGLDQAARAAGAVLPWVSTDEEGGEVARLANVVGPLPAPRALAASSTPAQVEAAVADVARRMVALGVTVDLAPVLDVASPTDTIAAEDTRSFSDDPAVVTAYGEAFVAGLEQGGVVAVVKHFPGLGHASADTDLQPALDPPLPALEADDLLPFDAVVERQAPVVMVGHPVVPGLTAGLPASLSPSAYLLLRDHLGFGGVAVTDSLGAGAISGAGYSEAAATVAAIRAGADLALVDATDVYPEVSALVAAVGDGALPAATLDRAVGLVLAAKGASPCSSPPPSGCAPLGPEQKVVAVASDPVVPGGYWAAWSDGCVSAAGGAPTLDDGHQVHLQAPLAGIAALPDGRGYWLASTLGQVVAVGAAPFRGELPTGSVVSPITGIATAADGAGYWLAAADGAVYPFGAARSHGSLLGGVADPSPVPVSAIAGQPGGGGYWLLESDGAVAAFGDAHALGGMAGAVLPAVALVAGGRQGYWIVDETGRIAGRGTSAYHGEGSLEPTSTPAVGLVPTATGYREVLDNGASVLF